MLQRLTCPEKPAAQAALEKGRKHRARGSLEADASGPIQSIPSLFLIVRTTALQLAGLSFFPVEFARVQCPARNICRTRSVRPG
jgi:hypothetical protein